MEDEVKDKPTQSMDKALDDYVDQALEKIDKIVELLLKAEEAYTMSKNAVSGDDWRKRRDGFRTEGTDYLNQAKELFLC